MPYYVGFPDASVRSRIEAFSNCDVDKFVFSVIFNGLFAICGSDSHVCPYHSPGKGCELHHGTVIGACMYGYHFDVVILGLFRRVVPSRRVDPDVRVFPYALPLVCAYGLTVGCGDNCAQCHVSLCFGGHMLGISYGCNLFGINGFNLVDGFFWHSCWLVPHHSDFGDGSVAMPF